MGVSVSEDKGVLKSVVKTWMYLCHTPDQICEKLYTDYKMTKKDVEKLYHECLVELGR